MLEETQPAIPHPRRIDPLTRALKPVQNRIGQLNEAAAFLAAFAQRNPDLPSIAPAIGANEARLAEALALFEAAVRRLPEKYHRDSRVADTRNALERIKHALVSLKAQMLPVDPDG